MIYCLRPLLSINNNISRECRSRGLYCSTWKLYSPCFRPREIHWYIIYYSYHNDVSCQLQVQLIPIPHSKEDDFFAIVSPPPFKIWTPKKGSNIYRAWGFICAGLKIDTVQGLNLHVQRVIPVLISFSCYTVPQKIK